MLPSIHPTEDADSFEDQLIQIIGKQPRRMVIPLCLSIVLIAGMAVRTSPLPWVVAWLAFATLVMVTRLVLQDPRTLRTLSAKRRLRITTLLVAMSGATHGLSLFFFFYMSPFEQAVLSMMLVGLGAGAIATTAGYPPIFLAYVVPTLCPLALLWVINPTLRGVGPVQGLMALLIFLFALVLFALARDTYRILRESYEIRLEREALNRDMQAALDQAEAANRAKTRFLASASHDLRQPMQTLSLFAAALAMRQLDERSRGIVENLNAALHDLTGELDALLDVSKLDAGVVKPEPGPFVLKPLVERIESTFALAAKSKGLQILVHCERDICVLTDRKLLERLLRNLVENAIKYTDAGSITIAAVSDAANDQCVLTVSDTGCGIDAAEQERVFEEFYQVDNPSRDRARGLGLGLSIVKRLTELLEIDLAMKSAPGEGTTFSLRLRTAGPPAAPAAKRMQPADSSHNVRVLVIDDEASVRHGMRALLEGHGCDVELAAGTEEAVAAYQRGAVDLLIADFRLHESDDGVRAIRTLRSIDAELPALLLTGETAPNRLREALEAGIQVLHKPVSPQLLIQEITKISAIKRSRRHGQRDTPEGSSSR